MTFAFVLAIATAVVVWPLLALCWWLERPIPAEPEPDRSRGTLSDWS